LSGLGLDKEATEQFVTEALKQFIAVTEETETGQREG
ncbi:ATP-dependent Clp protease ATP-binding subunit, partial [Streptomyces sp. WAC02707]